MAKADYTVKGTHVQMARKWIEQRLGVLPELTAEGRAPWPAVILASSWYDAFPVVAAIELAAKKLRMSVVDVSTDIAEQNARNDLTTVYRAFLRVAGPHMVMNATSALWRNYVAFGLASKITNEYGNYVGECHNLPNVLLDWACGCWLGFVPTAIELAGGKNCQGRIIAQGPEEGSQDFSWLRCQVTYQ